MKSKVTSAA